MKSTVFIVLYPLALVPKQSEDAHPIGAPFTAQELAQHVQLRLTTTPVQLSPCITFLGEIPRVHALEAASAIGQRLTEQGGVPDQLLDDTALVYESPDGLYIITACSHSGIMNICQYAQAVTGTPRILGIIGGFHLFGLSPQLTDTIAYFKSQNITELYPCHCVDFPARAAIHQQLAIHEVGVGLTLNW